MRKSTKRSTVVGSLPRRSRITMKYICQICHSFSRNCYAGVLRHLRQVHSFRPNFHVVCGLGPEKNCPANYTNFESFRSHIYSKHREELLLSTSSSPSSSHSPRVETTLEACGVLEEDRNVTNPLVFLEDFSESIEEELQEDQTTRAAALFILKTMEVHRISQV